MVGGWSVGVDSRNERHFALAEMHPPISSSPWATSAKLATRSDIPPDTSTFAAINLAGNPGMLYMYDIGTNPCSRYVYPKP